MTSSENKSKTSKASLKSANHPESGLRMLYRMAVPHWRKIGLSALLVLLVNAALILKPYILKLVIDDFLLKNTNGSGLYSVTSLGLFYFLVVILGGTLTIWQVNLINRVGQEIMYTLRRRVYRIIQLLPLSYHDKVSPGKLITRATNDVEALSELYTDVILSLFQDVFLLIGIIYTMLVIDVELAFIAFSVVPFMFLVVFVLKSRIKQNFTRIKSLIGRINGFMAENISGMKLIQVFHAEAVKKKEFDDLNDAYFSATSLQVFLNSFLKPAADLLQSFAVAIILWYGMGKIMNQTLELGVLYAFTTYIKQFFNPISDLADNYTTIQSALVSADRINELLHEESTLEVLDRGLPLAEGAVKGEIEFRHVWFAYDDPHWILKDVSFKILPGETAAFVGETGAGKSTIISLINRFYTIQRGEILLDGVNINDIRLSDLRRCIAVVLQDVFLFSGNIKDNLSLNDTIEDDELLKALKLSNSTDFINDLEDGMDSAVMERGSTFSAGQRQLLSFARAIAHNPSIFVLDEATANIDTHTEKLIQKAIENISKEKTTLVIAHRLSTIKNADQIIVLQHGRIVEIGTHSQLAVSGGYYSSLLSQRGKHIS